MTPSQAALLTNPVVVSGLVRPGMLDKELLGLGLDLDEVGVLRVLALLRGLLDGELVAGLDLEEVALVTVELPALGTGILVG